MTLNKKEEILEIFKSEVSEISKKAGRSEESLSFYTQNDFPTTKTEAWKDTDIQKVFAEKLSIAIPFDVDDNFFVNFEVPQTKSIRLVFVNGYFSEKHSDKILSNKQITILPIEQAIHSHQQEIKSFFGKTNCSIENNFTALNTAFAKSGSFILVNKNEEISELIHLIFLTDGRNTPSISQVRNLIVLGENSKASILESYVSLSGGRMVSNNVSEIFLKKGAKLELTKYQVENENDFLFTNTHIEQESDSELKNFIFSLNGNLIRNDLKIKLNGEGANALINGLSLADKSQHFDNNVLVTHAKGNCNSNQLFKSLIDDEATCIFAGKVFVAQDAQKTNAKQSNKNILLTETATAHSKPQLEIYADDVACSHGSTTGQIDNEALFYMQARGLSKQQARALLLFAFAAEIAKSINNETVKIWIENLIDKRLRGKNIIRECKHVFFK